MKIRQTTAQDVPRIDALLHRSYPVMMATAYDKHALSVALPLMTKAKPDLLASGTFYPVEEAGDVLGCGGWTFGEPGSGRTSEGLAHLRHFAVDPAHTRQGVGRLIFKECTHTASRQGALRFQAFSSLNAESFYAGMGLKRLDIVRIPMREDVTFPVALMEGPVVTPR
ncbi:GNAT family N-acetyltransferase [Shinella sp.]|uniref:GNAT family N-acetyltransferase n=1 Tax=Shinella sp. TaxID=1870904 RepID=UPI003D2B4292